MIICFWIHFFVIRTKVQRNVVNITAFRWTLLYSGWYTILYRVLGIRSSLKFLLKRKVSDDDVDSSRSQCCKSLLLSLPHALFFCMNAVKRSVASRDFLVSTFWSRVSPMLKLSLGASSPGATRSRSLAARSSSSTDDSIAFISSGVSKRSFAFNLNPPKRVKRFSARQITAYAINTAIISNISGSCSASQVGTKLPSSIVGGVHRFSRLSHIST